MHENNDRLLLVFLQHGFQPAHLAGVNFPAIIIEPRFRHKGLRPGRVQAHQDQVRGHFLGVVGHSGVMPPEGPINAPATVYLDKLIGWSFFS